MEFESIKGFSVAQEKGFCFDIDNIHNIDIFAKHQSIATVSAFQNKLSWILHWRNVYFDKTCNIQHYFKQTGNIGSLLSSYRELPKLCVESLNVQECLMIEAVRKIRSLFDDEIVHRLYATVSDGDITPLRLQTFQDGELTCDCVYQTSSERWFYYLDEPTAIYELMCRSNGFVRAISKEGLQVGHIAEMIGEKLIEQCPEFETLNYRKGKGERIVKSIRKAIGSAFWHQNSLASKLHDFCQRL